MEIVNTPQATHEGDLIVGEISIPCAVLDDGRRLLTQGGFLTAIGRNQRPKAGSGILDDNIAALSAPNLAPYIPDSLAKRARPVYFLSPSGKKLLGYEASLIPEICNVYRDASFDNALHHTQQHIAVRCEILIRSFAQVGIIALIDEATGYQDIRARNELELILERYLTEHRLKWAKTFPDDFYKEMFRLRGWQYSDLGFHFRPGIVGKYTNDIVYDRLAPGVLEELRRRNPKDSRGNRTSKHHQWLSEDHGVPELKGHIAGIIALMKASASWNTFKRLLDRAYPKLGDTLQLPFDD